MSNCTHFIGHPVYAQVLKLLDKEKPNKSQNKRFKRRVSAEGAYLHNEHSPSFAGKRTMGSVLKWAQRA